MLSHSEYTATIERRDTYEAWAEQFKQRNGWTVIPADAKAPVDYSNDDRSAIEIYEFCRDKPAKYFAYVKAPANMLVKPHWQTCERGEFTTWTGDKLGTISFGRVFRDNFGGTRVPITVHAITGETYHGTYYASSGDFARIRKAKRQALAHAVNLTLTA